VARGSLSELETQIIISRKFGYLNDNQDMDNEVGEIFGLLGGLMKSINAKVT
jgi:four helix bundle protein